MHCVCGLSIVLSIWLYDHWVLAIAPPGRNYPSQKVDSIACFPAVSHLQLIHLGHDSMTSSTFRPLSDGNRAWLLRLAVSNKKLSEMKFTVNITSSVNLECRHGCAFHGFRLFREVVVLLTYTFAARVLLHPAVRLVFLTCCTIFPNYSLTCALHRSCTVSKYLPRRFLQQTWKWSKVENDPSKPFSLIFCD